MRPSLQMQNCVDKEEKDEESLTHVVRRSLPCRFSKTDEHFAAVLTELVGEDVWYIRFLS